MAAVLDFVAYIGERTKEFTGREWVLAEIDRWLADGERPTFFIITGEPGVGKSALAARLTQVRPVAAYHFCIARDMKTVDPVVFARSLALQLCQIDGFAQEILQESKIEMKPVQNIQANYGQVIGARIENLVVNAPSGAAAFTHAVLQPLQALCATDFAGPLVLLVDALDEAVQRTGETIVDLLANAGALPRQVRVVLTSRPEGAVLRHFQERQIPYFRLDADRSENQDDIRRYTQAQIAVSEDLRFRLTDQDVSSQDFAEWVMTASQGNFLYVIWLLRAITAGAQRFDTLDALPQGLDSIYREFLRTRKTRNEVQWRRLYEPLLGVLVAAQAPLTQTLVSQFTNLPLQEVRYGLQDLDQFMDPASRDEGHYFLYHQSVVDWLKDEGHAQEFWVDVVLAHHKITDYYWNAYSSNWHLCDDYGLNFLAFHLLGAEQQAVLTELLTSSPNWMEAKVSRLDSLGYIGDIEQVLQSYVEPLNPSRLTEVCKLFAAQQVTRWQVIPNDDNELRMLVWLGRVAEALMLARSHPNPGNRFYGLLVIHRALMDKGQQYPELLVEMQQNANSIKDMPDKRLEVLIELAIACAEVGDTVKVNSILDEVSTVGTQIYGTWREWLIHLAELLLTEGYLQEADRAFTVAHQIASSPTHGTKAQDSWMLLQLSKALVRLNHFGEAESTAYMIADPRQKIHALAALAVNLFRAELKSEITPVVEEIQRTIAALAEEKNDGLLVLADMLIQIEQPEAASKAYDEVESSIKGLMSEEKMKVLVQLGTALASCKIPQFEERATTIFRIAQEEALALPERKVLFTKYQWGNPFAENWEAERLNLIVKALIQTGRLQEACAITEKVANAKNRAYVLCQCVEKFAEHSNFDEARRLLAHIEDEEYRATAMCCLGVALAGAGHFTEANEIATTLSNEEERTKVKYSLVEPLVRSKHFVEAASVISTIANDNMRARALSYLAASLAYFGNFSELQPTLHDLKNTRKRLIDFEQNAQALLAIADKLIQHNCQIQATAVLDQAWDSFQEILNREKFSKISLKFVSAWISIGYHDRANAIAHSITQLNDRAHALQCIAVRLAETGRIEEAIIQFEYIQNMLLEPEQKDYPTAVQCLTQLAVSALKVGCTEAANHLLVAGKQTIRKVGPLLWSYVHHTFVVTLIEFGRLDEALIEARQGAYKVECLTALAIAWHKAGNEKKAIDVFNEANIVAQESPRELICLAKGCYQVGYTTEARRVLSQCEEMIRAESCPYQWHDLETLTELASVLSKLGEQSKASGIFAEVEEMTFALESHLGNRGNIFSKLAICLAEAGYFERAQKVVLAMRPNDGLLPVVAKAAYAINEIGVSVVDKTQWPWWQARFKVAREYVKARHFIEAFALLEIHSIDEFIPILIEWTPLIEQMGEKLIVATLLQVVEVAGWVRTDWKQVHQEINHCWATSQTNLPSCR